MTPMGLVSKGVARGTGRAVWKRPALRPMQQGSHSRGAHRFLPAGRYCGST